MKTAQIYRMSTDKHICPYGLKALDLLKRSGYTVEDYKLTSREETDAFKNKHSVETTPQVFIDDKRVGGFEDLQKFLNIKTPPKDKKTYTPVIAVFSVCFGLSLASTWLMYRTLEPVSVFVLFVAFSVSVLSILKLRDLDAFSTQFITYDLLAMRWLRYAYIYPFLEALVGMSMISKVGLVVFAPISFLIGSIGAVSVFKAVYIDKRDLKCACVGGQSNVPLGFISLTENLMMIFMGIWMLIP